MNIQQFAAHVERSIAPSIVAAGLRVSVRRVVQGPMTLTIQLELLRPATRTALQSLLALGPTLAVATNVAAVRIQQSAGTVLAEFPLPQSARRSPSATELARYGDALRVCVGMDALRRPVLIDLTQHGAVFWVGPSRRGKTQSIKATLYAVAANSPRARYVILSQKQQDWLAFRGLAGCLGVVSDAKEALDALAWLAETLHIRAASGCGGAAYVVVADDLLNLLAVQPECAKPLAELSSQGAGLGIHLLVGTQEAGSKRGTGGGGVENNATARILYKSSNAGAGARAAGAGGVGLEHLSGSPGDALLLLDGEGTRMATAMCDDADVLLLPAGGERNRRPWAQPVAQPAQPVAQPAVNRLKPVPNWLQPPQPVATTHSMDVPDVGILQPAQPVAATGWPIEPLDGFDRIRSNPAQPVAATGWPIERRPLTADEVLVVRDLASSGWSANRLCKMIYAAKDGRTYDWIRSALQGETPEVGER